MFDYKSLVVPSAVSFVVSTMVVLANNYYFRKYHCKKQVSCCTSEEFVTVATPVEEHK